MIPATVLAAAVLLSISATADATVAAAMFNAGRQVPARALADAEALGQWLSRYGDVARQIRELLSGESAQADDELSPRELKRLEQILKTNGSFDRSWMSDPGSPLRLLTGSNDAPPAAAPIRRCLTDMPPPLR